MKQVRFTPAQVIPISVNRVISSITMQIDGEQAYAHSKLSSEKFPFCF